MICRMLVTNILTMTMAASPRTSRTRDRIESVALDLFAAQGFEATTVAQIAAAAGVTQMTVFRYFARKEAFFLEEPDPWDPLLVMFIAAEPVGLPLLHRVTRGIRAAWSAGSPDLSGMRRKLRIAAASPTLQAVMLANTQRTQDVIAEQLTADGADPVAARVAAAATLAALTTGLLAWAEGEQDAGLVITAVLDILEGVGDD